MQRFRAYATLVAIVFGLIACGDDTSDRPIARVETPPPASSTEPVAQPSSSEGLPADWFVASSDGNGLTLEKLDDEDAWVWVALESSVSGSDFDRGIKIHRKAVEDSPAGTFVDSGTVETSKHGSAAWSWGTYDGDEGEEGKNELVLHIAYPPRNTLMSLRYLYPLEGGPGFDDRLAELVAIADGLSAGS